MPLGDRSNPHLIRLLRQISGEGPHRFLVATIRQMSPGLTLGDNLRDFLSLAYQSKSKSQLQLTIRDRWKLWIYTLVEAREEFNHLLSLTHNSLSCLLSLYTDLLIQVPVQYPHLWSNITSNIVVGCTLSSLGKVGLPSQLAKMEKIGNNNRHKKRIMAEKGLRPQANHPRTTKMMRITIHLPSSAVKMTMYSIRKLKIILIYRWLWIQRDFITKVLPVCQPHHF